MPQHKSAEKRVRQIAKRRAQNRHHKVRVRSLIKELDQMDNAEEAQSKLNTVKAYLDRMVSNGIVHRNRAAQTKSRLEKKIGALSN
ncbi:30S ribosomal protein S20 [soil metagenome]